MSLYVGNLSYEVTDQDLTELFSQYGNLKSVQVLTEPGSGRSRGFGFVEYDSNDDEDEAQRQLDGKELMGRPLKVDKARPKQERSGGGPRSGGRGEGGGGYGGGGRRGGSGGGGGYRGGNRGDRNSGGYGRR
jgi:RNA recognition motif-containing protein